ncbi:uncharacterized protein LOC126795798 [Argentina anserina]|uniref:uncharacterized protein LOC126795798 n=1 Tax=Argentina anserina TaxID=57926 RepID=UPI0021764A6E|nr:uncharacterized protein LOC126795798 [Potentilla anserina]
MSSVLDSPLEALAFDYVSFGLITVVNSLWTWLAVVTAAVSFWRLRPRAVEGLKFHSPSSDDVVRTSNGCSSFSEIPPPATAEREESPSPVSAPSRAPVPVPSSSGIFEDDGGLKKGVKFTLYFDDEDTNGDVYGEGDLTAEETEESGSENWWETGLKMRTEEKSWYRYQDLTVFNGNVVRLWDNTHGCRVKRWD